jgi:pimeloyl-ACP methyl ester carboxylesterase
MAVQSAPVPSPFDLIGMGEPRYTTVSGVRTRYLVVGEGPPMLLMHGWIGSAENFHKWMPALARRRQMIIPDLPGFGETPALSGPHTVAAIATFVEAFASAIDLRLFDLGGLCLGATLALELAKRDPQRIRQLVLHTPIYSRAALSGSFKFQSTALVQPVIWRIAWTIGSSRLISGLYRRFIVGEGPDVDRVEAAINYENQTRASGRAAREWLRDAINLDYSQWLREWEQPVLMIVASDDHMIDLRDMQRLTESMQTAEVVVIPEAGHGWNEALVKAQAAAISGFLSTDPI